MFIRFVHFTHNDLQFLSTFQRRNIDPAVICVWWWRCHRFGCRRLYTALSSLTRMWTISHTESHHYTDGGDDNLYILNFSPELISLFGVR